MTPEDLLDFEHVRQLKARYFRLLDQKKWDEWALVFCEDVTIDTRDDGAPLLHGRAAFREFLPPILDGVTTVHHGHMAELERVAPDLIQGTWSMEDRLWWPPEAGRRHLWGTGWYQEKYRRDPDGQWRILELVLRRAHVEMDGRTIFPRPEPS